MAPLRSTYVGLFLVALSTLTYEILLTRIFSVSMWYHFAFVAISVAMFGMTVGAVVVYAFPSWFPTEGVARQMAVGAALFSVAIVVSFLTHLSIPFVAQRSLLGLYSLALNFAVLSLPFVASGVVVCLALTRFPRSVGRLYAADLIGAALGCLLLVLLLDATDAPTAVFVVAALVAVAAFLLSGAVEPRTLRRFALALVVVLGGFALINTVLVARGTPLIRLIWVKGAQEPAPLAETWNSHSRVQVLAGEYIGPPYGANMSRALPPGIEVDYLRLNIDASASTVMTRYDGDATELAFLKYDLINMAHHLRGDADVLVVGTGGGRDVLSALAFDQASVTGVELNADILELVNGRFGDFTGHLDRDPRVTFVNDEARSYIERAGGRWDIIQVSFIDTWAATAAGAYVLTENSLYTVEAWATFLDSLAPRGVLTFSRWYDLRLPGSAYRLTALATAALARLGVDEPRDHIILVRNVTTDPGAEGPGAVGTILVSPDPFSNEDLDRLYAVCAEMGYDIVLSPRNALDETFAALADSVGTMEQAVAAQALDISPPTDDRPFFFHLLRPRDIFRTDLVQQGRMTFNQRAVYILIALLAIVIVLTLVFIAVPLAFSRLPRPPRSSLPLLGYFASIGLAFMLVEVSQLQRLSVFLGHPTYALVVVLFTILLASGVGSWLAQLFIERAPRSRHPAMLAALVLVLAVVGVVTPVIAAALRGADNPVRIATAVGLLVPMGLLMGFPFPLAMSYAAREYPLLSPWLWGINGATSVSASVLAMVIALFVGISAAYWAGTLCYVLAAVALWQIYRSPRTAV